jgi:hypothetical protein
MLNMIIAVLMLATPAESYTEAPPLFDHPAIAYEPAVRLDPPIPPATFSEASSNGRCVGAESLLGEHSPGWNVERMSRIMYRESRCQPQVRNRSGATGLLQIMPSNCRYIAEQMGEACTVAKLSDPLFNIRAGAVLFEYDGYRPWAL